MLFIPELTTSFHYDIIVGLNDNNFWFVLQRAAYWQNLGIDKNEPLLKSEKLSL